MIPCFENIPLRRKVMTAFLVTALLTGLLWIYNSDVVAEEKKTEPVCDQTAPVIAPKKRFDMTPEEFEAAAEILFHRCHRRIAPGESAPSLFRANVDFPTEPPEKTNLPWLEFHPVREPAKYLDAVLGYAMNRCGGDHVDWDGRACDWYHAPWMHDLREPMRGLTRERSSRLGELHPSQTVKTQNWAVSLYNEIGGHGFHRIWQDRAYPKTNGFAFDNGTMAVKLLFSLATPEQVPYLRFAKTWDIHNGEEIVKARLMQVDVLVKDDRVADGRNGPPHEDLTGWVMGSFLYNGAIETTPRCDQLGGDVDACEEARWRDRLLPIGLQWGNDPQINNTSAQGKPVQHWLGEKVTNMFTPLRLMSGHPPYLGYNGRMNGPVDNHRSTCLACHGRAVDFGRHEENALRLVPFVAHADPASDAYPDPEVEELQRFFRNLNSDEPFLEGTQSLDYSLQAAVGLSHYRKWVDGLPLSETEKAKTSDFRPTYKSPDGVRGSLKLATWNIANLHHETGVALRMGAPEREVDDYSVLAKMAKHVDADIVALQEIGSPAALSRVFPREKYHLVMSGRYTAGDELRKPVDRDIFTAFAFSREKFPKVPRVKTVEALSIGHMQWDSATLLDSNNPTRAAMSVEFEHEGDSYALLNVHLKSGCPRGPLAVVDEKRTKSHEAFACRTLVAQLDVIENWFELQHALGHKVIMMGDFNRGLNWATGARRDDFWVDLNDGTPIELVKGPADRVDDCWKDRQKNHSTIDFIVGDKNAMTPNEVAAITKIDYSVLGIDPDEYKGNAYFRLSDHCPVVMVLGGE